MMIFTIFLRYILQNFVEMRKFSTNLLRIPENQGRPAANFQAPHLALYNPCTVNNDEQMNSEIVFLRVLRVVCGEEVTKHAFLRRTWPR